MIVCQWHLDIPYGKQAEALEIMQAWAEEKLASSDFRKARSTRLMVGHVGRSASHIIDEYVFDSLADFESALAGMGADRFRTHSDRLAPYIVPGSQHWEIFRVIE